MQTTTYTASGARLGADLPQVRRIGLADLRYALRQGLEDFWAKPSHYVTLGIAYPIIGIFLAVWTSGNNAWPLLFPLLSGFAIVGPLAAVCLYEISRQREAGHDPSWRAAFATLRSPALPAILVVGIVLLAIFAVWIFSAQALYQWLSGDGQPMTFTAFLGEVFTTSRGWTLIVVGNLLGAVFALVAFALSVVSLPLLVDRPVGAGTAMRTSLAAVRANPVPMLAWGVIVAVALAVGAVPLLLGLAFVVPVLGHATWHLYRRVVV